MPKSEVELLVMMNPGLTLICFDEKWGKIWPGVAIIYNHNNYYEGNLYNPPLIDHQTLLKTQNKWWW